MQIGVIVSMKDGLDHFIYRELTVFSEASQVHVFPTKKGKGLYSAKPQWIMHSWNVLNVILAQFVALFSTPKKYLETLRVAFKYRAFVDFAFSWYFARYLDKMDVIYSTFGDHKLFIGYFGKLITGKPLAVTIHAYELYQNPNPALFVTALQACDQVMTVTDYNRELISEKFGVAEEKIDVIRITVDTNEYHPEKKFSILIVAYFVERKGHEILFRAVKQMKHQDVEVWVAGEMGERDHAVNVEQIAIDLGMTDQIAFFGGLSGTALKALYRTCDVFCLPCHTDRFGVNEGFPTVIAEAMAFAKPVVSTRHVEIPRILDRMLVNEYDIDCLAEALDQVYESQPLRDELGQQNRQIAEKLFSTNNAAKTFQVLNKIAGQEFAGQNLARQT
jgi:colanic acid/amylovoran biosynthesis glycosyltransferase